MFYSLQKILLISCSVAFVACSSSTFTVENSDNIIADSAISDYQTGSQFVEDTNVEDVINSDRILFSIDTSFDTLVVCPDDCLNIANDFDCLSSMQACTEQWNPSWQSNCLIDIKYCSLYQWSLSCLKEQYTCWRKCTDSCNACSDGNLCHILSYVCKETCQQENIDASPVPITLKN